MSKEIAIDLADTFSLLAVWLLTDCEWKLLKITRLKQAIALAQEPRRLVFPTHVNPSEIFGSHPKMIKVGAVLTFR